MVEQEIARYIVDVWRSTQRGMCSERDDEVKNCTAQVENLKADEGPEDLVAAVHGVLSDSMPVGV